MTALGQSRRDRFGCYQTGAIIQVPRKNVSLRCVVCNTSETCEHGEDTQVRQ
jgi:hypothetical protein